MSSNSNFTNFEIQKLLENIHCWNEMKNQIILD